MTEFLTDGLVDRPGLPGRTAAQSIFYQLKTTTTAYYQLETNLNLEAGCQMTLEKSSGPSAVAR